MIETPARYRAEPRPWEDKDRLYKLYWGELLSTQDIADRFGISQGSVRDQLQRHGIPRRAHRYGPNKSVSPFSVFYDDQPAPAGPDQERRFDPAKAESGYWRSAQPEGSDD